MQHVPIVDGQLEKTRLGGSMGLAAVKSLGLEVASPRTQVGRQVDSRALESTHGELPLAFSAPMYDYSIELQASCTFE